MFDTRNIWATRFPSVSMQISMNSSKTLSMYVRNYSFNICILNIHGAYISNQCLNYKKSNDKLISNISVKYWQLSFNGSFHLWAAGKTVWSLLTRAIPKCLKTSAAHSKALCCMLKRFTSLFSDRLYPPMAYTGGFLQWLLSGGANRHKLITSFTQTKVVTTSFKAMRPQKL